MLLSGVDDGSPMPDDWLLSRICEEFQCVPSVADAEFEDDPVRILNILEMRGFARAKEAMDRDGDKVKMTPTVRLVMQIEAEQMKARAEEARASRIP